jgi:hypothetical protein
MTSAGKVVLVAAAVALGYGLYSTYSRIKQPEPGSRPWQIQQFRKDWKACSEFASKREDARKLLAWKPAPWVNPPGTAAWQKEFDARRQHQAPNPKRNSATSMRTSRR